MAQNVKKDNPKNIKQRLKSILGRPSEAEPTHDLEYKQVERPLPQEQFDTLVSTIKDWQISHGSLLKLVRTDEEHTVLSKPPGVALFPTQFPDSCFEEAIGLSKIYNELYAAVSEDAAWLHNVLKDLLEVDDFAKALWRIHETVKEEGYVQPLSLGLFRSDYMLHGPSISAVKDSTAGESLRQVEFNTYCCSGAVHADKIGSMHQHLALTGANIPSSSTPAETLSHLPTNDNTAQLAAGLAAAHAAYGSPKSANTATTAVLMIVQPYNFNVTDERALEYALWSHSAAPIPTYRILWGAEVLSKTNLTSARELLYTPTPGATPVEVSVVYHRAGIDAEEYTDPAGEGIACRLRLERSRAIKCPSVLAHLAGFKMVQQALAQDETALRRFLPHVGDETRGRISRTWMSMYALDESARGKEGQRLAMDEAEAKRFVLKPSLEGGGHNVYGTDIVRFLRHDVPRDKWKAYVLMERIRPPEDVENVLMSPAGMYQGPVVSELGVLSVVLWRKRSVAAAREEAPVETLQNYQAGWTFKSKAAHVDEMSVVKGYGCFDCPYLV